MNLARILLIVAAIVVAGLTAFLVNMLLESRDDGDTRGERANTVEVLVAERDLPAGLIITGEHLVWQEWPEGATNRNYLVRSEGAKKETYLGYAVASLISAGEPILKSKVIEPGTAGFLPGALKPGMRAFTIKVSRLTGTAGFVVPGMHVDLVHTFRVKDQRKTLISETIMQNVRVLAIDSKVNDSGKAAQRAKSVTIEVKPAEVERLALATRLGQIRVVVRSLVRDPGCRETRTLHRRLGSQ